MYDPMPTPALTAVPTDDALLVEQSRAGDERAFATLYRRHARYVAGVVFRITGNDGDVDDVMQEAFVDAHAGLSGLREPAGFRAWLVRIAGALAVDHLRRDKASRREPLTDEADFAVGRHVAGRSRGGS